MDRVSTKPESNAKDKNIIVTPDGKKRRIDRIEKNALERAEYNKLYNKHYSYGEYMAAKARCWLEHPVPPIPTERYSHLI